MADPIKIAIIDDNITIRSGLCALLSKNPDFQVIGESGFKDASQVIDRDPCLLLLRLEQKEGEKILAFIRELHTKHPSIQLMVIAHSCDDPFVLKSLKAGAIGCLVKESSLQDVKNAIYATANGNICIPSSVSRRLIRPQTENPVTLPAQQLRVLKLIFQGYSNDEIAKTLIISKRTVEMHTYRLFKRLGVSSRTQAIQEAIRNGLIDSSSASDNLDDL